MLYAAPDDFRIASDLQYAQNVMRLWSQSHHVCFMEIEKFRDMTPSEIAETRFVARKKPLSNVSLSEFGGKQQQVARISNIIPYDFLHCIHRRLEHCARWTDKTIEPHIILNAGESVQDMLFALLTLVPKHIGIMFPTAREQIKYLWYHLKTYYSSLHQLKLIDDIIYGQFLTEFCGYLFPFLYFNGRTRLEGCFQSSEIFKWEWSSIEEREVYRSKLSQEATLNPHSAVEYASYAQHDQILDEFVPHCPAFSELQFGMNKFIVNRVRRVVRTWAGFGQYKHNISQEIRHAHDIVFNGKHKFGSSSYSNVVGNGLYYARSLFMQLQIAFYYIDNHYNRLESNNQVVQLMQEEEEESKSDGNEIALSQPENSSLSGFSTPTKSLVVKGMDLLYSEVETLIKKANSDGNRSLPFIADSKEFTIGEIEGICKSLDQDKIELNQIIAEHFFVNEKVFYKIYKDVPTFREYEKKWLDFRSMDYLSAQKRRRELQEQNIFDVLVWTFNPICRQKRQSAIFLAGIQNDMTREKLFQLLKTADYSDLFNNNSKEPSFTDVKSSAECLLLDQYINYYARSQEERLAQKILLSKKKLKIDRHELKVDFRLFSHLFHCLLGILRLKKFTDASYQIVALPWILMYKVLRDVLEIEEICTVWLQDMSPFDPDAKRVIRSISPFKNTPANPGGFPPSKIYPSHVLADCHGESPVFSEYEFCWRGTKVPPCPSDRTAVYQKLVGNFLKTFTPLGSENLDYNFLISLMALDSQIPLVILSIWDEVVRRPASDILDWRFSPLRWDNSRYILGGNQDVGQITFRDSALKHMTQDYSTLAQFPVFNFMSDIFKVHDIFNPINILKRIDGRKANALQLKIASAYIDVVSRSINSLAVEFKRFADQVDSSLQFAKDFSSFKDPEIIFSNDKSLNTSIDNYFDMLQHGTPVFDLNSKILPQLALCCSFYRNLLEGNGYNEKQFFPQSPSASKQMGKRIAFRIYCDFMAYFYTNIAQDELFLDINPEDLFFESLDPALLF